MGLGDDAFGAADALQLDSPSKLPALCQGDGGTDPVVGPRTKPNRDFFDFLPLAAGVPDDALDEFKWFCVRARFNRFVFSSRLRTFSGLNEGHASLRRGKFKRQDLHI